jgi:hypothetical protein
MLRAARCCASRGREIATGLWRQPQDGWIRHNLSQAAPVTGQRLAAAAALLPFPGFVPAPPLPPAQLHNPNSQTEHPPPTQDPSASGKRAGYLLSEQHAGSDIADKYELRSDIGRGAYAVTRVCVDLATGQHYAAKSIAKARLSDDERKRVRREMQVLHALAGARAGARGRAGPAGWGALLLGQLAVLCMACMLACKAACKILASPPMRPMHTPCTLTRTPCTPHAHPMHPPPRPPQRPAPRRRL